jgi:hypothetical protein
MESAHRLNEVELQKSAIHLKSVEILREKTAIARLPHHAPQKREAE